MDAPPPYDVVHVPTATINSTPAIFPPSNDAGKATAIKKKTKKKRKPNIDVINSQHPPTTSSCCASSCCASSSASSSSSSRPVLKGVRLTNHRRNPRVLISSVRHKENDAVEALALPLGMSIAAFVAQVLERKDAAGEAMSVDQLSKICTLAVAESLANVFGNKFDCFVRNFEKSFQSTLMTLRLINESSQNYGKHLKHSKNRRSSDLTPLMARNEEQGLTDSSGVSHCQSEAILNSISTQEQTREEFYENMQTDPVYHDLPLLDIQRNQQLARISPSTLHLRRAGNINQNMLDTMEKTVMEQSRSNDLKTFEIGLLMKKMQLKETQLSLNCDSHLLERFKLSMGISKASFKAEKFKNEVEDRRHAELLQRCVDCLVAGLIVMLVCLAYGTYTYSHQRITEVTASCTPSKDSSSWWVPKPMASFSSGLQILRCQVQVISRELFGVIMIAAIAYLLLQRSSTSKQTMPVTFILLLLGVGCGFAGYWCINTLGGSGYHWFIYWEILCLLHLFSNIWTSTLFLILYGPVTVTEKSKEGTLFPYWIRRFLYHATALLFLPMCCGLVPFASVGEWKEHFSLLLTELRLPTIIE